MRLLKLMTWYLVSFWSSALRNSTNELTGWRMLSGHWFPPHVSHSRGLKGIMYQQNRMHSFLNSSNKNCDKKYFSLTAAPLTKLSNILILCTYCKYVVVI